MGYIIAIALPLIFCVMTSTSYGGYGTSFKDIIYPTVMSVLMTRLPDQHFKDSMTSLVIGSDGLILPNDTEISCKAPLPVENSLSGSLNSNYPVGTTITFNCSKNTHLVGEMNVTCLETGNWNKEWPSCERDPVTCSAPPEFPNMELVTKDAVLNEYTEGYILHYQCDDDFEIKSEGSMQCSESGWVGQEPFCDYVRCSKDQLPKIQNAKIKSIEYIIDNEFAVDTKVYYKCKDRHVWNLNYATDIITVECLSGGIWRDLGALSCNPEYCPHPRKIDNGKLLDNTQSKYKVGSNAYVKCKEGFKMKGAAQIDCQKDGTWSELPQCFPVCSKPKIPFGEISTNYKQNRKDFQIGDWYTYNCDQEDPDVIHAKINCIKGSGGTAVWDRETPNCKVEACSPLGTIKNGYGFKSVSHNRGQNIIVHGDKYEFDCNDKRKFKLQGAAEFTCIHGEWDHQELPSCVPIYCDKQPTPDHGIIVEKKMSNNKFTPGDWVKISCTKKYNARNSGVAKIMCGLDGKWDRMPPVCEQIKCPTPPNTLCNIDNRKDIYQPEDTVFFSAPIGFKIHGERSIRTKCLYSGEWDGSFPTCSEITCSVPHATNCHITGKASHKYKIGETVSFQANSGNKITGNTKATCTSEGTWKDLPECKPLERCKIPDIPQLASSNCPKFITEGQTVTCACGLWSHHNYHGKYVFSCAAGAGGNPSRNGECYWSCFKDDTQIFEINGKKPKNLKDFTEGDKVYAIDPKSQTVVESKVTSVQCNDESSVFYQIELENGYKINGITENHFMNIVADNKIQEVAAKNVKQSQIVYILTKGNNIERSAIINVQTVTDKGFCNIETEHGNLFIEDGINVSTGSQSSATLN